LFNYGNALIADTTLAIFSQKIHEKLLRNTVK
jgi:hypothetical protein